MSRSNPITWRNVAINDGSGSASLGNAAAGFGRSAIQGLSIFSDQMDQQIAREDERLTNEAIAAALSGGPQVSGNRRVDADALQVAVERNLQGRRLEEAHTSDLETARLAQIGQGQTNDMNAFKISKQEEAYALERQLDQALLADRQQQTAESRLRVDDLRRRTQEAARAAEVENRLTTYFAEDQENEFKQRFEEEAQSIDGWDQLTQDERDRLYRQRRDNVYLPEVNSDPYRGVKIAKQLGFTPREYYASVPGQEDLAAQRLVQERQAERLLAREEADADYIKLVDEAARTGNLKNAVPDPSAEGGFTFVKNAKQVTDGGATAYASSIGADPKDEEVANLIKTVKAAFPGEAAFRAMLKKSIDDDGNVIEGAEDRIYADQQAAGLLAESIVAKSSAAPTLGNASGDLQTAVNAVIRRQNGGANAPEVEPAIQISEDEQTVNSMLANLEMPPIEIHPDKEQSRDQLVNQIEKLAAEVSSQRNSRGLPLSTNQLERAKLELIRALERAAQPPLAPINPAINIGIQPK